MSNQQIGQGPGNVIPDSTFRMFKCAAAVTKGWAVALSGEAACAALVSAGDADAITGLCVEGADTDIADGTGIIGYAMETGAALAWIRVCTGGFCNYIITDNSVAEGDHLIPTASPGVVGGTVGTTRSLLGCGIALDADSGTLLSKAFVESKF